MLTVGDGAKMPEDNWDQSKHTPLENAMNTMIKILLQYAIDSPTTRAEFARSVPILWGNE
jgi:hypothetical protein